MTTRPSDRPGTAASPTTAPEPLSAPGGSAGDIVAGIRQHLVPQAIDQLSAVIEATESAANQIMSVCEALASLKEEVGEPAAAQVEQGVTAIFEACAFQDITGQRIAKATKTLRRIDQALGNLRATPVRAAVGAGDTFWASQACDPGQLAGPQRPGDGVDQSGADWLFSQQLR
jgi:chemotaxis protein CheZ